MVSEKNVSLIALVFSLCGFFSLLLLSMLEKPVEYKISDLENSKASIVQVKARIVSSNFSKNTLWVRLFDGNSISAVFYNPPVEVLDFAQENNLVIAVGSLRKQGKANVLVLSKLQAS